VWSNPANVVIGDRAFGRVPDEAVRHALAFWRGLEAAGVRGCGKHFPGHGDTLADSHHELPSVHAAAERLRSVELAPFAAAVRAGVSMFMTAHVIYPAIDDRPATLSHRWLTGVLRGELGFGGVVVSDDLDMKAVAGRWPVDQLVVESLLAGVDCFLACRDPEVQAAAEEALEHACVRDAEVRRRVAESAARLATLRAGLARPPAADAWRRLDLEADARLAASVCATSA
jgi:beta-N-acetylhexosaminidase